MVWKHKRALNAFRPGSPAVIRYNVRLTEGLEGFRWLATDVRSYDMLESLADLAPNFGASISRTPQCERLGYPAFPGL